MSRLNLAFLVATVSLAGFARGGDEDHDVRAAAVRDTLGQCTDGDLRDGDLNGDGCVNALDAALLKLNRVNTMLSGSSKPTAASGGAEQIVLLTPNVVVSPGESVSILFQIRDNTTPLLGYSLDLDIGANPGAEGEVRANVEATEFYEVRNLITAGGATLDPLFSVISDPGDGGVFVNALTDDNSTVLAVTGVNDILARVILEASTDASGDFNVSLGPASVLSDGGGFAVPFTFGGGSVTIRQVVPAASSSSTVAMMIVICVFGAVLSCRRCVKVI